MKVFSKIIIIILISIFTGCSGSGGNIKDPITMSKSAIVKDKLGNEWEFSATEGLNEENVFMSEDEKIVGSLKGAFATAGHFISESDYPEFKAIVDSGRCPAKFLNKTNFLYLIVTDKDEIVKTMKTLKQGDKVEMNGYFLDATMYKDETELPGIQIGNNIYYVYLNQLRKL
ncbi:MAG: hypothetical protein AB1782_16740 [Cyanobacteriota bacterium]